MASEEIVDEVREVALLREVKDVEAGGLEGWESEAQCRFCLQEESAYKMIAPCLCAGSQRWVHRECLDEWRAQESVPSAFTHCPTCRFQYIVDLPPDNPREARAARCRYYFYVSRDLGVLFILTQLVIAFIGRTVHIVDHEEKIAGLFPVGWASRNRDTLDIGPYYCSGVAIFFVLLGVYGVIFRNRIPWLRSSPRARQNTTSRAAGPSHGNDFCMDPACCGTNDCCGNQLLDTSCCDNCHCPHDHNSCSGCDCHSLNCDGEAGPCLMAVGVVVGILLLALAVLGVFVAVFFGGVVLQQIMQRHLTYLAKRSDARRAVVRDLGHSETGDLVENLRTDLDREVVSSLKMA